MAIVVVLCAVAGWVGWKGSRPDPALFAAPTADLAAAKSGAAVALPAGLAPDGWTAGAPSTFDASNLYVKINGRADFFLTRGFRSLTFVSLASAGRAVDVELYDLGSAENALSAFGGEKPPEVEAVDGAYQLRNALFLVRGAVYARLLGSEEGAEIDAALSHVKGALVAGLAAGEKPWTHALFERALAVPSDRVAFFEENAFSFGFAAGVTVATLDDGSTEAFVMPAADPAAAKRLAARFEEGFLGYGEKVTVGGVPWVKDRYLGGHARAVASGRLVLGMVGAPDPAAAAKALAKLQDDVTRNPPAIPVAKGSPAASKDAPADAPAAEGGPAYE